MTQLANFVPIVARYASGRRKLRRRMKLLGRRNVGVSIWGTILACCLAASLTACGGGGGSAGPGPTPTPLPTPSPSPTPSSLAAPTIAESFGAPNVAVNGTTSLAFTITNPAANTASLTGVGFSDTLPSGLVISTPNGFTNSCSGTATALAGTGTLTLSGGTVAAGSNCTLTLNVTATASGNFTNGSSAVSSSNAGTGNTATAVLTVATPPAIAQSFAATSLAVGGTTSLSFTITNPAVNTLALTGISFSDVLPAGIVISAPNALLNSCGGTTTAVAGSGSLSLSGASLAAGSHCTLSVNVIGSSAGSFTNTSAAVTSLNAGTGNTATASLTVVAPPSLGESFGAASIPVNGITSLSFTVSNPTANTVGEAGVAFTDTLPAGLIISTPNGLANSCGGTVTAPQGTSAISLSGGSVVVGSSCAVSVSVTGTAAGILTNATGAASSTNGGTGTPAVASLTVGSPPAISENFAAPSIPLNGNTSLSYTVNNTAVSAIALSGVGFSDSLPTGLMVATPSGLTTTCTGTAAAATGSSLVSLSVATLAAGASCTLSLNVTGTTTGAKNNSVTVGSTEGGTGNTATASIAVVAPPVLAEGFSPTLISENGTTSLSFTISNPAANTVAEAGVAFTDTLPAGLIISTPNALTNSCSGILTATQGTSAISLSGGSVPVGGSCTLTVNVTDRAAGTLTNPTGAVSSANGGTGNSATASLTVGAPPSIAKSFGAASIPLNGGTSLSFTVSNTAVNAIALTGVSFSDTLPAGLVVATPNGLAGTCGGGTITATAGTGVVSLTGAALGANTSCTFSANVKGTAAGAQNNITGGVTSVEGGTGGTASASVAVAAPPIISEAFAAASMPLNGSATLSFTIANPAGNTVGLTGVGFSDTLPTGLIVSTPNGLTGSCGGGTIIATQGTSLTSLSGASLAANTSCTFSLNVTGTAAGAPINTTGNVASTEGGTGGSASATIAVAAPPSIAEAFGAASIALNGTTSLTFTITNPAANTVSESGVAFLDTLPSGLIISTPSGLTSTCGGTVTATAGTTSISLSGGSMAAVGSCTVTLNVTGTSGGTFTNTTGAASSTNGGTGNTASASLTVTASLTLSVSPSGATIALNKTQTYTASGTGAPVNWSVNGVVNGNPTVGTISAGGVYTAPASFPGAGVNPLTITAISQANSAVTASASATVVYPNDTSTAQTAPVKLGTSGSNVNNTSIASPAACCVGTLGALMNRSGTLFILSNDHVLTNVGAATVGDAINQPGPAACFASPSVVANFSEGTALRPTTGTTGQAPDNVDAALAQVAAGQVDTTGSILDFGVAGASSIAAAPPSSTTAVESVGLNVAKSGRTTGLTCSTVSSILTTVTVDYDSACGGPVAFSSTFVNQIVINNSGGGFAAPGDSGALIVTRDQARPIGLLFAGTSTTAVANPIRDVINAFTVQSVPRQIPGIVGGADHAVSCAPIAIVSSGNPNGTFSTIVPGLSPIVSGLSAVEQQRVDDIRLVNELLLTRDPMISSVATAASEDSPGEGALEIRVSGATQAPIPAVIGGVRTRVVFAGPGSAPAVTQQDIDQASSVKEANAGTLLGQPGIQGVGVAISKDNPGETAIAIYVVRGETYPSIPATLNGVRTQVIEGERFRAF